MSGNRWLGLGLAWVTLVASLGCRSEASDRAHPGDEAVVGKTHAAVIWDEPHSGESTGFFFLPPMVSNPTLTGAFARNLAPVVTIEERSPATGAVVRTIATYTINSGPDRQVVRDDSNHHYMALWHTRDFDLSVALLYRINVALDGRIIGFADVVLGQNGSAFKNVDKDEYLPLLDGQTLPIKFRLNGCAPVVCARIDQCHAAGACNPNTELCSNPAAPNGTACDDGNPATSGDTCTSGICGSGTNACPAPAQCRQPGVRDPGTGQCTYAALADGTACPDADACNGEETCQAGACAAGPPPAVDDGNQCTADACDPAVGVTHTLVAAGTSCADPNACNGAETCDGSGTCAAGIPVSCTALDQCHVVGTCHPATGVCSNPPRANGAGCDDANACTVSDTCQAGTCQAGAAAATDDGKPCTTDSCDPGTGVAHTPVAAGTSCADGNACNGAETCSASGSCSAGTPVSCAALDQCHVVGTCDPATGVCSNPARANGTGCDDANACTVGDTCQTGSCEAGAAAASDDGNPCTADSCDPGTGVAHTPVATGTACGDGNACNGAETCSASGLCSAGTPVSCAALDQCHVVGTCDPATGACSNPARANGTGCDDANACTVGDTCQAGSCAAGVAAAVDDGNPCTADSCDPGTGVAHTPVATGTACGDGNACNGAETCDASGSCSAGTPVSCTALDPCHVVGTCDPATGVCSNPARANGAGCDDANACTVGDTCQVGSCAAGVAAATDDGNPCTADSCDPGTGVAHTPLAVGTTCADGNACNGAETCAASGACAAGTPVSCTALDQCHVTGTCNPATGVCSNPPRADGATCNDGSACTVSDTCEAGTCQAGSAAAIDDGNPCTADACDPTGGVTHTPVAAGTSCGDGNVCNGAEMCSGIGFCQAGVPPDVDDGNPCTFDGCDPSTGPTHLPLPVGITCADGNSCNGAETCGGGGICAAGAPPIVDDGNPCTADSCDPALGVVHVPAAAGTVCPDGDACNGNETCDGASTCQAGVAPSLDDGNPCTTDACNPSSGVSHLPLPAGASCGTAAFCDALGVCQLDLPPDPADVAPELNRSTTSSLLARTAFLFAGPEPIQTGVTPGALEPKRASLIRGRVLDPSGGPFPGVDIRIFGHPELGSTVTRADGQFDLVVNGGGALIVQMVSAGHITAQRAVNAPWNDAVVVDDVVMVPLDANATLVDLGEPALQVVEGAAVTDTDGTRRAILFVEPGTTANMVLPDGSTSPMDAMSVRITELTEGPLGPRRMPGDLPATSGYTYAVELTADEAEAAGAVAVKFDRALWLYVDNFLDFTVGTPVPLGSYDRTRALWIPEDNGRVIRILGEADGLALVDVDGSGVAAEAGALAALGFSTAERARLAATYPAGTELWRSPVVHFSPWDANWARVPDDPPPHKDPDDEDDEDTDDDDYMCGSIVETSNQILGESVPVAGTPFRFGYRSDRVPGRESKYHVRVPISGSPVGSGTIAFEASVMVAGQRFGQSFSPAPNQTWDFTWDGRDAYGRIVQGAQSAVVSVARIVRTKYVSPSAAGRAFGAFPVGAAVAIDRARDTMSFARQFETSLGTFDMRPLGLGGWNLTPHHAYDVAGRVLYLGDGSRRNTQARAPIVERFAGRPGGGTDIINVPALDARFSAVDDVAVAADGTALLATGNRILRVDGRTTVVTALAGRTGSCADAVQRGDGGPATLACLNPTEVEVERNGDVIIAESGGSWGQGGVGDSIRRVDSSGRITTIAGRRRIHGFSEQCFYPGDGGPAVDAELCSLVAIAAGPEGNLYTLERGQIGFSAQGRLRMISPDGVIRTVVSGLRYAFDTGFAGLDVGPDGSVYFTDGILHTVRKLSPDGKVTAVAGSGIAGFTGDGSPATAARLDSPAKVAVARDGTLFISDRGNRALRVVTTDGIINTLAGSPTGFQVTGDNGPVGQAQLGFSSPSDIGPDGALYFAQNNRTVRRVRPAYPGGVPSSNLLVPSADGGEVYEFSPQGRHVQTRHALTGGVLFTFAYDAEGRLQSITDGDGNVTSVLHDEDGELASIVSPYGHATTLEVDANGYLSLVRDPAAGETLLAHGPDGLLESMVDPRGGLHTYDWSPDGRLIRDEGPSGRSLTLTQTRTASSRTVSIVTSEGKQSSYTVTRLPDRMQRRTAARHIPLPTTTLLDLDSQIETITEPDGMVTSTVEGPSPRWAMLEPLATSTTLRTPGGVSLLSTRSQAATINPADPVAISSLVDTSVTNGLTSTSTFSSAPRTVTSTSPTGRSTTTTLNARGRPTRIAVPGVAPVDFVYDSRGRLASVTQAGRTTTNTYGPTGDLETITNALLQTETFEHDPVGRVTARHRPDGSTVAFAHDAAGNLTSVTPPGKPTHLFTYTPDNKLETYVAPDAGGGPAVTAYQYDLDGKPTQVTRPDGSIVTMDYDSSGRMDSLTMPGGAMAFGYSPTTAKLTSVTGPYDVHLGYTYDGSLLTETSWSGAVTGSVGRTYDSFLRVATETINGLASTRATFGYDNDGLVTSVATPGGTMTLAYDPAAPRLTGTTLAGVSDSRTYDHFGELRTYTARFGTTVLYDVTYTRDSLGRIQSKVETVQGDSTFTEYGYDEVGRLITVAEDGFLVRQYGYDANGNRTRFDDFERGEVKVGEYDAQDRIRTYGDLAYAFTENGSLRTKVDTVRGDTTTYTTDALGNLTRVDLPDGRVIEYIVDPDQRRVGKKVDGLLVKQWLYRDDLRITAELDGAGNVVSRFVWADGAGANESAVRQVLTRLGLRLPDLLAVAIREGRSPLSAPAYVLRGGALYGIFSDHLGTPRLVVDVATGSVVHRLDVDEWGVVEADTSPGWIPFGFAAGLYDPDAGLVRFGAREYDAGTGLWTGKDPIRFDGSSPNLYAYALGDPMNLTDRSGLDTRDDCITQCEGLWGAGMVTCLFCAKIENTWARAACFLGCSAAVWAGGEYCKSKCPPPGEEPEDPFPDPCIP